MIESHPEITLMQAPRPKDEEFCRRVEHEISEANLAAAEIMSAVTPTIPPPPVIPPVKAVQKPKKPDKGNTRKTVIKLGNRVKTFPEKKCASCGAPHKELTEGCANCYQRHKARRRAAEIKGVKYEIPSYSRSLHSQVTEAELEVEVLISLSLGLTITEITKSLRNVVPWKYENTRQFCERLRGKYGARNNTALVAKVIRRGIIA